MSGEIVSVISAPVAESEGNQRVLRDTRGVRITVVDDLPAGKELANVGQEFVAVFGAELRQWIAGRGA